MKRKRTRMIPTPRRDGKPISLTEWLGRAFSEGNGRIDDIHLDQLASSPDLAADAMRWVVYSCDVVSQVVRALPNYENLRGVQQVVAALPLGETKRLRKWKPRKWLEVGTYYEPPSLLLTKIDLFSDRFDVEYFRRVKLPVECGAGVTAAYWSGRHQDGVFVNTIFLVAAVG